MDEDLALADVRLQETDRLLQLADRRRCEIEDLHVEVCQLEKWRCFRVFRG